MPDPDRDLLLELAQHLTKTLHTTLEGRKQGTNCGYPRHHDTRTIGQEMRADFERLRTLLAETEVVFHKGHCFIP
jgi:hypothetical protein